VIIDRLRSAKNKDDLFTQIQCFAQLARNVGNKLAKEQIAEVFPSLTQTTASILQARVSAEADNGIAEACLFAIESMVKRSPKEVEPYLEGVLKLASQAVVYDPNYEYIEDDDQQMDEDDGWGDDEVDMGVTGQDDDDSSWKIRRAAVKLIDAIITSRPDLLRKVY
jgi:cullin-associated NEDD8-dissociated protein 1